MHFSSKTIAKLVGMILMILGIAMLPSLICALCTSDQTCLYAFGISTPLSFGIGLCMYLLIPRSRKGLLQRDGYLAVVVCWISGAVIGALPYILSGFLPHFYDAFFESMSGLSTTGATVTRASMPAALILWKAMMHWLGGMGILIFIIAILPALGVGGQRIASAEAPGSELAKMSPRINDISKMLYLIYSTMTGIEFLLLWLGSTMGPFEALVNTLGSISTAGLLYHQGAVSAYQSLFVELVISIFTIFSSTNFIVYISLITKSFKQIAHNIEVRTYFGIIAAASILIAIILKVSGTCATFGIALRHGFFQAVTFASTDHSVHTDVHRRLCSQHLRFTKGLPSSDHGQTDQAGCLPPDPPPCRALHPDRRYGDHLPTCLGRHLFRHPVRRHLRTVLHRHQPFRMQPGNGNIDSHQPDVHHRWLLWGHWR